jgi:hypothetical protein
MNPEQNQEVSVDLDNGGEGETENDYVKLPKSEWEKHNQTMGSLKRELKDLKKAKEEAPKETPTNQKPDDALLQRLEKVALRTAGITDPEDIELARKTAQKWGMDIEEVITDEDFKVKLEKQQSTRANTLATSDIKGSGSTSQAKLSPEYWMAKGVPPTAQDVPDRKTRAKIARAMMQNEKSGSKFYNE